MMSSPKQLQYNCLEELNQQIDKPPPNSKPHLLLNSLSKLLSKAQEMEKIKDEESAYVCYMRYIDVYQVIKTSREYKKDPKTFDTQISKSAMNTAIVRAEAILKGLEKRYKKKLADKLASIENRSVRKISPIRKQEPEEKPSIPASLTNGVEKKEVDWISPKDILNLMTEKCTPFLIFDVRDSQDFKVSHVQHLNVINIPGEYLTPGVTSKSLERQIHIETRSQFQRRTKVDKLILMDWNCEKLPSSGDQSKLTILKDALIKWDTNYEKCRLPLYIAKGGFEDFGMMYPMDVTNPKKVRAPENKPTLKNDPFSFNEIEYPDLDNGFIASPSPASSVNTSIEVIRNGSLYPSTAELANSAVLSGAITITKGSSSPARKDPPPSSLPILPDRSTKPAFVQPSKSVFNNSENKSTDQDEFNMTKLSDSLSSSVTGVMSDLNQAVIEADISHDIEKPSVDRSSKAKAILKIGSTDKKELAEVLDAERDLVEDTIQLEKKQLEMEQRWEILRLKREKSAEEDMRLEVMKKEEMLLDQIQQMSLEKEKKDQENESLREQLDQLKTQMKQNEVYKYQNNADKRDLEISRAMVTKMEEERRKLQEEVQIKRAERLRKLKADQVAKEAMLKQAEMQRIRRQKELEEAQMKDSRNQTPKVTKVPLKKEPYEESKTSLNRSHSSPNIAQMLDNEPVHGIPSTPKQSKPNFDRTSKPASIAEISQARMREFQPVWGSNVIRGLTGLKNLGNTCYMNSILQCLANTRTLGRYFVNRNYSEFINEKSPTRGEVALEFAEVIIKLWSGSCRSISPIDFKRVIGKYKEAFRGHDQQDAHELLVTLMEWLHNDVNEVRVKVTLPEQKNEGIPEDRAADNAWEMEMNVDRSFFRELFYGQWKSSLTCKTCGWASVKYESFFELALPLPGGHSGRFTLEECVENFLKPEIVSYTCPKCKRGRDCSKKFDIVKLPKVLTVQLVRFYNDGLWRKKQNFINFKLTNMNFGKYATACSGKKNRYTNYNLFAVCNHFGSMEGGHYTAYCHSDSQKRWHKYDDHEVNEMDDHTVVTPAAYVLFYSA